MNFPNKIVVTEQEINLSDLSDTQKKFYLNLAEKIKRTYSSTHKDRCIISVSGRSGSGKSVLSIIISELLKNEKRFQFYALDLDAFHFQNSYLEKYNLKEAKGRFDTYNTEKLYGMLVDFNLGKNVTLPSYSRITHEPNQNGPVILSNKAVLMVAGLWFQRNDSVWNQIRSLIDYSFGIDGSQEQMRLNTINRHIAGGRSRADAEKFFEASDHVNNIELANNSISPNEVLPYFEDISPKKR